MRKIELDLGEYVCYFGDDWASNRQIILTADKRSEIFFLDKDQIKEYNRLKLEKSKIEWYDTYILPLIKYGIVEKIESYLTKYKEMINEEPTLSSNRSPVRLLQPERRTLRKWRRPRFFASRKSD